MALSTIIELEFDQDVEIDSTENLALKPNAHREKDNNAFVTDMD